MFAMENVLVIDATMNHDPDRAIRQSRFDLSQRCLGQFVSQFLRQYPAELAAWGQQPYAGWVAARRVFLQTKIRCLFNPKDLSVGARLDTFGKGFPCVLKYDLNLKLFSSFCSHFSSFKRHPGAFVKLGHLSREVEASRHPIELAIVDHSRDHTYNSEKPVDDDLWMSPPFVTPASFVWFIIGWLSCIFALGWLGRSDRLRFWWRLLGGVFGFAAAVLCIALAFHLFTPFATSRGRDHHHLPQQSALRI
jgi:hypothetical protein